MIPMNDENRPVQKLTSEKLGSVFRSLADEYTLEGAVENEETWAKIEARGRSSAYRRASGDASLGKKRVVWAVVAAAACGLAALGIGQSGVFGNDEPFGYAVDGARASAAPASSESGELIASEETPLLVEFTDDTRVKLQPFSTLRVSSDAKAREVTARLSQGRADFASGPDSEAKFTLKAGVYTMLPLGAKFSFGYMPQDEQLELNSSSGVILVTDETGKEYRVEAGGTLRLPEGAVRVEKVSEDGAEQSAEQQPTGEAPEAPRSGSSPGAPHAGPTFKELAAEGKFAEVVALAKQRGVPQVLASASASELQQLAQAARYSGDFALAARTWNQMTTRFSGPSGHNARFFLGRLAEDRGDSGQALRHYDAYLASGGGGVYTAEALGRKLSIVNKSHGAQKARPIAREYLRRFPQGAYAKTARELAGGE